jgi:hypothetical protein
MLYDLNTKNHKTITIGKKVFYIGEITEELKADIGKINEDKPEREWKKIIIAQLEKYNEDFNVPDQGIQEREIISFIKAVS